MKNKKRQVQSLSSNSTISVSAGPLKDRLKHPYWEKKWLNWGLGVLIAVITFLVYLPSLQNGFVNWDDGSYVYENLNIRSIDFRFLKWNLTAVVAALWHPLTMLSLAVDYAFWGLTPLGYHLTNNLIHSANTFLIFILSLRLLQTGYSGKNCSKKKLLIASTVTALLFGIHPIHVESVAWVAERKDVLCAFFFLLSLISYTSYVSAKSLRSYVLCLVFFVFALLSKPMAVSLPIVLLILDYYPHRRLSIKGDLKGILVEKLPFFLFSLLSSLTTIWAHQSAGGMATLIPLASRILSAIHAYTFYLTKMLIPVNLAPLYPYSDRIDFFAFKYISSIMLVITITSSAILLKWNKLLMSVWVYYLITLLPVTGIIQVGNQAAADRYTYLPCIGPFLLVGLGIGYMIERHSKKTYQITLIAIFTLLFGIAATKTVNQISIWQNSITLWTHELKVYPEGVFTAYLNRGIAYDKSGNYQQALNDYNAAIKINPFHEKSYINRGGLYANLGDLQSSILDYNKAEGLNPRNAVVYYNRGNALRQLGNNQLATKDYDKAIEVDPQYVDAYYNRGNALSSLGDFRRAIRDFDMAIKLNPGLMGAYSNRGIAYNELGDYRKAISDLDQAIRLNPKSAEAYNSRGLSYEKLGDYQQAIQNYKTATEVNPQFATAYYNLSIVYELIGDMEQSRYYYGIASSMRSSGGNP